MRANGCKKTLATCRLLWHLAYDWNESHDRSDWMRPDGRMHSVRLILLLAAVHRRGLNLIPGFIFFSFFFLSLPFVCAQIKREHVPSSFFYHYSQELHLCLLLPPATVGK